MVGAEEIESVREQETNQSKAAEVYAGKLIRELAYRLRIRRRRVQVSVSNKSALDF